MAGIGERNQRKYVIPAIMLTTNYIYLCQCQKYDTLRLETMTDLENYSLGFDICETDRNVC